MNNPLLSSTAANAMAAALGTLANAGYLFIYEGTQPAGGGSSAGSTQLAMFNLQSPCFNTPNTGSMGMIPPPAAVATATGTAQWFRINQSDGATPLLDGTVGTSGCDLNLATTSITDGDTVAITSFTVSLPV